MDSRKVIAVLALGVAPAVWNPAAAQGGFGPGHGPHDPFLGLPPERASIDTNADGTISPDEMKAARSTQFKAADADHDGVLTLAESKAWMSQRVEDRFKALDTDGNGQVSVAELTVGKRARGATIFSNLLKQGDLDGSGALSPEEFRQLASAANKAGFFFAVMDENGDGQVSEAEYLAPPGHGGHRPKARHGKPEAAADDA